MNYLFFFNTSKYNYIKKFKMYESIQKSKVQSICISFKDGLISFLTYENASCCEVVRHKIKMKQIFNLFIIRYQKFLGYLAPSKLNYFWNLCSLAFCGLRITKLIAFCLSWYKPQIDLFFLSLAFKMHEMHTCCMMRCAHTNGVSFLFLLVCVHMGISLYYYMYYPLLINLVFLLFVFRVFFYRFKNLDINV